MTDSHPLPYVRQKPGVKCRTGKIHYMLRHFKLPAKGGERQNPLPCPGFHSHKLDVTDLSVLDFRQKYSCTGWVPHLMGQQLHKN